MAELRTPEKKAEIVKKCIDAEMAGESVLDVLKGEGYVSPRATWMNMQKRYLGRDSNSLTDGVATGCRKRGKRPRIRVLALDEDRMEWEQSHANSPEEQVETVFFGGKPYDRAKPVTTCCAPSTRKGVEVPDVLPEEPKVVQAEEIREAVRVEVAEAGRELVALKVQSRVQDGIWEYDDKGIIYFMTGGDSGHFTALRLTREEWQTVIREFPKVCGMMGIA